MTPERLRSLSIDGLALGCLVEEHVMFAGLRCFEASRERWSVIHEGENGPEHLTAMGALPSEFAPIRDRLFREQETDEGRDVDFIFDIPIELGAAICGFRHDLDDAEQGDLVFTGLKPARRGIGARIAAILGRA